MPKSDLILVVDDDPAIVSLVSDSLSAAGYSVTSANDAAQALIQAAALKPKLIISDIQMPTWGTGVDAYRHYRENAKLKDIPVIFMTGLSPAEARRLMPEDPKVRLLAKPLDWIMLEQAITELLGESKPLG